MDLNSPVLLELNIELPSFEREYTYTKKQKKKAIVAWLQTSVHFIRYKNVAHQVCMPHHQTHQNWWNNKYIWWRENFVPNISLDDASLKFQAPGMFAPPRKTVGNVLHLALQQRFRRLARIIINKRGKDWMGGLFLFPRVHKQPHVQQICRADSQYGWQLLRSNNELLPRA
jgi:hypothetical protein